MYASVSYVDCAADIALTFTATNGIAHTARR
jgi:hypothetical protein